MSYQFGHVDRDERIDLAADEPVGEPARWSVRPTPLLTILVMAVFAGGLWFAYVEGTHHAAPPAPTAVAPGAATPAAAPAPATAASADNIPVIHADPQPIKVKPEQPGGMVVPDRDKLIYNERPGGPPVEKLLPPPEQPAPRPTPPQMAALAPPPPPPAPVVVQQEPVPPAPVPSAVRAVPPQQAAKPHPTPVVAAATEKGGHIRIQLGSVRSAEEARDEWQRLKRLAPEQLGKLTADAVRADLGERGVYYRIEAGSFAEVAAAEHLCRELKERRLGCQIVR